MTETGKESSRAVTARWTIVTMTIALTAGAVLYRVLLHEHLGQTAAMFLGIPAVRRHSQGHYTFPSYHCAFARGRISLHPHCFTPLLCCRNRDRSHPRQSKK
jgi:hypothetical protein